MSGPMVKLMVCIPDLEVVPMDFAYDLGRMTAWTTANCPDITLTLGRVALETLAGEKREELVRSVIDEAGCTHILVLDPYVRMPKDMVPLLLTSGALPALTPLAKPKIITGV